MKPVELQYNAETSTNWSPDEELNGLFLRHVENFLNDRLRARGYVFLNDALDELGIARIQAGQVLGWGAGSCVEFNALNSDSGIKLEFNVDGNILGELDKGVNDEDQLEIEIEMHKKLFEVLEAHPHVMERRKLRDYLDFFFNPGEVIFQETVRLIDEKDLGSDTVEQGRTDVELEGEAFLMHAAVPHDQEETGGMWVELHSVNSSITFDNHDKFKRMLGRPVRVTVEILSKES